MNKQQLKNIKVQNDYFEFKSKYYDFSNIQPLNNVKLISVNKKALELIGLNQDYVDEQEIVKLLNGQLHLKDSKPYSMVYAGHQFGYFVPQLGDGRAINLGSINNWHLQLKGIGITKYSRSGDGRAVLRSSIREYLMSEAMYGLNIPTTRALAIIGSNHIVYRDMGIETGSIVLRLSPSWIRIGTFEYFYTQESLEDLTQLANFVIKQNYPHLEDIKEQKYEKLFYEIVNNTASLLAKWQSYGFMHGVMNTDNMSVAAVTIDYGPFAFMDSFKMDTICNHTDKHGRYSFENQPLIAQWNLSSLATAFSPLVKNQEILDEYIRLFLHLYKKYYYELMNKRLGLDINISKDSNSALIKELLKILQGCEVDYNLFFRRLSANDDSQIFELCRYPDVMQDWLDKYKTIRDSQDKDFENIARDINKINPKYILKNYIIQEAIDKAEAGDFSLVNDLLNIAQNPFDEHKEFGHYAKPTPKKFNNIKLSCSS